MEYITVYVDDLTFVVRGPKAIITLLEEKYRHELKGTGSIFYHLGCDFFRDNKDIVCMALKKYIDKLIDRCTNMFNMKHSPKYKLPLEKGDHPDLDTL